MFVQKVRRKASFRLCARLAAGVLVAFASAGVGGAAAAAWELAGGADAVCPIVVAADATPAERYAAAELATHLHELCGAAFPVTNAVPAGPAIVLAHDPDCGAEGYRLRVDAAAGRLTIGGGRPRGVLYGAYALLDEDLGCRWFTPAVTFVPRRDRLTLPADLDRRGQPRLEYREVYWTEALGGDWAARNRLNASHASLAERHGGKVTYGPFVHTFNRILDPDDHFAAHPEYFSMVKGKRLKTQTQLCLTNPEVLDHAIRAVRRWIAANPAATIFSVSQNDWRNPCDCPACHALDEAEGSHAGTLLTFVNSIADAIATNHPGVAIDTLAYQYTRKPPRTVRPRPNVIVRLCSIECCFAHPLDGCPEATNQSFMEDLRGWHGLSSRLYVWDYTTDFAHYLLPFPNLGVLGANVRTFAENGVAGLFEQGNYSPGGGGELAELRAWVLARLLWEPTRAADALIREFVVGVYGPAAPHVQRYLELRGATARAAGNHVRIFDGTNRPDLPVAAVAEWDEALAAAEQAAAGDAALAARIERLRLPVWYTQAWQARAPAPVVRTAAARLAAGVRAQQLTHLREFGKLDRDLARLALAEARRPYAAPEDVRIGEDDRFSLHREGELVTLVADPAAEDGVAARMVGRSLEWAVQWRLPADVPPGRYRLGARIRVEKEGTNGVAFHGGAYDSGAHRGLGEKRVSVADAAAGYRLYDLVEFDAGTPIRAYVAPNDNAAAVKAIYVDRFELAPIAAGAD